MLKFINNIFKAKTTEKNPFPNALDDKTVELFNQNRVSGAKPVLCYAPFSNMFFDIYGKVYACCISNKCYDTIKDKTIKQIWEGDKFNELRTHIKNNDLSFACDICNSYLKSHIFQLALIKMFDGYSSYKSEYPKMMEFELANTCNLECVMCNNDLSSTIRTNRDKLPPLPNSYDDNFVTQLEEFIPHLEKARFIGGEPFLIDIYYKIWDKIININPSIVISVSTNGTVLNQRIKDILDKVKFEIIMSIDSFNKETYELIRVNAKYDTVINNLQYFREYCNKNNTHFNISVCPIRLNWKELPEIVKYVNNIKANLFFNTIITPFDCALWNLSSKELNNIVTYLSNTTLPESNNFERHNKNQYNDLISQIKLWKEKSYMRENFNLLPDSSSNKTNMEFFIKKFTDYMKSIDVTSEEEINKNIDLCASRVIKLKTYLPPDYNLEFLYSLLIDFSIKKIYDNILSADDSTLENGMKYMITNHFYKHEL